MNSNAQTLAAGQSSAATAERISAIRIGDLKIDGIVKIRVCESLNYNNKENQLVELSLEESNRVVEEMNQLVPEQLNGLAGASKTYEKGRWNVLLDPTAAYRFLEVTTQSGVSVINLFGQDEIMKNAWLTVLKSVPFANAPQAELDRGNLVMYDIHYEGSVVLNKMVMDYAQKNKNKMAYPIQIPTTQGLAAWVVAAFLCVKKSGVKKAQQMLDSMKNRMLT